MLRDSGMSEVNVRRMLEAIFIRATQLAKHFPRQDPTVMLPNKELRLSAGHYSQESFEGDTQNLR